MKSSCKSYYINQINFLEITLSFHWINMCKCRHPAKFLLTKLKFPIWMFLDSIIIKKKKINKNLESSRACHLTVVWGWREMVIFNTMAVNLIVLYPPVHIYQWLLNFSGMCIFFTNKTQKYNLVINIGYLKLIKKGNQ